MESCKKGHKGLLIVIEGTDGSGKSTQIEKLRRWIEDKSYGCMVSEWKTSRLIANVIDDAKDRNLLNATTFSLLYAADFADRLENTIIPALDSGFVVLLDRYTYTAFARDVVRGLNIDWVKQLYNYAPEPDLVFYLDMPIDVLLKRVIGTTGLDYWESGRDIGLSTDFYESFKIYQAKCLEEYNKMKPEYNFVSIDGTLPREDIHNKMIEHVEKLLNTGKLD
ncbi:MAG TPA: dTMP kinase [Candidatus Limenecus avicola]|jgi:dTMP kinase|uniref:Thymidylate kinase n=1 Tax=Candidatus Limenecus avicola TaxID=2840847 RepID=A0A9D1SQU6_9CLOT|nr:thymidylate kinase 2 [Clostridium sp. CAG:306]HIU92035.1 dTMP kinase [Candidatus Limenecus avicola]